MSFVCSIPGIDPATAIWHTVIHLGLTGFVVSAGSVFLALAIVARRRATRAALDLGDLAPAPVI